MRGFPDLRVKNLSFPRLREGEWGWWDGWGTERGRGTQRAKMSHIAPEQVLLGEAASSPSLEPVTRSLGPGPGSNFCLEQVLRKHSSVSTMKGISETALKHFIHVWTHIIWHQSFVVVSHFPGLTGDKIIMHHNEATEGIRTRNTWLRAHALSHCVWVLPSTRPRWENDYNTKKKRVKWT